MADTTAYLSVYVSQSGSSFSVIMSRDQADKLYRAVYEDGCVVAVWLSGKAQSTGIVLNPARGGVVLNIGQAAKLPVDANGNPIPMQLILEKRVAENQVKWLEPNEQPHGEVLFPPWGTREDEGPAWARLLNDRIGGALKLAAAEAGVDLDELLANADNGAGGPVVPPPGPVKPPPEPKAEGKGKGKGKAAGKPPA